MCSYFLQSTKSVITPDGNAQLWLENYYDSCHHHYYRVQCQNRRSSGNISSVMHVRVWACGTFEEDLVWNDTLTPGQIISHSSHIWTYGTFCGAQADNYDTYVYTPTTYHNPTTYLTI